VVWHNDRVRNWTPGQFVGYGAETLIAAAVLGGVLAALTAPIGGLLLGGLIGLVGAAQVTIGVIGMGVKSAQL
jgi:hypothetical protein